MVTVTTVLPKLHKPAVLALILALPSIACAQALRDIESTPSSQTPGVFDLPPQPERIAPTFLPGVRSSITYSNNLDLTNGNSSSNGTVLELSPYIRANSVTPTLKYKVDYALRLFRVLSPRNEDLKRQSLNASWSAALYDNWLWFDGSAFIANVVSDLSRPIASDPGGYSSNTQELRGVQFSPNIKGLLLGSMPYQARYTFGNNSGEFLGAPNSHTLFGVISGSERSGQSWNWSWTGEFQRRIFQDRPLDRGYAAGSLMYQLTQDIRLTGGVNFERIQGYFSQNGRDFGYGPFVGFNWRPVDLISVDGNFSRRYYSNVWQLKGTMRSGMFAAGFDASQSLQTSLDASTFLFDGTSLLGNSGNNISPVAAQLLQQNLLFNYGIPFSAALISNAEILTRKVSVSAGLVGFKNSLTFSANKTQRDSQGLTSLSRGSIVNSTRGQVLGPATGSYFAQMNTHSASINYQHRFDQRSTFDLSYSRTGYESPSVAGGFSTRVDAITGSLSTKLTPDVTAGVGARKSQQRSKGNINQGYDESAVFGSIDVRF